MMTTQEPPMPARAVVQRPWYREPWPWVAIGIPAVAVVASMFTLYLAITNPDYLVVDDEQYQQLHSELRAQPAAGTEAAEQPAAREKDDAGR
ncbi:MAG: FixH family protein [Xanthomonadales bacterium]|nr:FixH family protein [Xanthomonadales bacterium]